MNQNNQQNQQNNFFDQARSQFSGDNVVAPGNKPADVSMLYQLFPQPTQSGLNSSYNSSENHIAMIPTSGESFENNTGAHGSGFSPTAMNEDSGSNGNSAPTVQLVASHHMNEDSGSNENFAPTVQPISLTSAHLVINCSDRPSKGSIYQASLALCTTDIILNQSCANAHLKLSKSQVGYKVS
ncbi:hypothetical protein QYF36_018204 [Acer negundo]|nr:hypothetical protein QYF36_018204 [Acer negundo]